MAALQHSLQYHLIIPIEGLGITIIFISIHLHKIRACTAMDLTALILACHATLVVMSMHNRLNASLIVATKSFICIIETIPVSVIVYCDIV